MPSLLTLLVYMHITLKFWSTVSIFCFNNHISLQHLHTVHVLFHALQTYSSSLIFNAHAAVFFFGIVHLFPSLITESYVPHAYKYSIF